MIEKAVDTPYERVEAELVSANLVIAECGALSCVRHVKELAHLYDATSLSTSTKRS